VGVSKNGCILASIIDLCLRSGIVAAFSADS
jgi:hypothetical protein